jgi:hypothetical protein
VTEKSLVYGIYTLCLSIDSQYRFKILKVKKNDVRGTGLFLRKLGRGTGLSNWAILSAIIVHFGKFMIAENKISSNKG